MRENWKFCFLQRTLQFSEVCKCFPLVFHFYLSVHYVLAVFSGSLTSESTPDNCQETRTENRRGKEVCKKLLAGDKKLSKLQLKIAISYGWNGSLYMVNVFLIYYFLIVDFVTIYALSSHLITAGIVIMYFAFIFSALVIFWMQAGLITPCFWLLTKLLSHLRCSVHGRR